MNEKKQPPSWKPLAAAGAVGAVLLLVLAGVKLSGKDDVAPPVAAPLASEPEAVPKPDPAPPRNLTTCLETGAQCGAPLPLVVLPGKPVPPSGYRSLRRMRVWPAAGGTLRAALQTNPHQGVGDKALVLAELSTDGSVATILPPVAHGARAHWVGDAAWIIATPNQQIWTLHKYAQGAWTEVGRLDPHRTAEGIAATPDGAAVVYLQADTAAVAARFDGEGGVETVSLLPQGLPWLRTHFSDSGDIVALRSREAEDKESPPRLEVAFLAAGSDTPQVTETTIPELAFDKVGFVVEHCFSGSDMWALLDGHILMVSHDTGRSWSRGHTYAREEKIHGVSMACAAGELVLAGIGPNSKAWVSTCTKEGGCTALTALGGVHAHWVSAHESRRVLWRPAGAVRVGLSQVVADEVTVEKVSVASGLDDARKALQVVAIDGRWFPF